MAIEAIKGAGMVYQGSTSTAQVKEESQSKAEVSSKDNQMVSDRCQRDAGDEHKGSKRGHIRRGRQPEPGTACCTKAEREEHAA